jgi:hypothetical protein
MTQRGKDLTEHDDPGTGGEQGGGEGKTGSADKESSRHWTAESESFSWDSRASNQAVPEPRHDQPVEGGVEQVETGDGGAEGGNPSGV